MLTVTSQTFSYRKQAVVSDCLPENNPRDQLDVPATLRQGYSLSRNSSNLHRCYLQLTTNMIPQVRTKYEDAALQLGQATVP
jgi:hypothetical protein